MGIGTLTPGAKLEVNGQVKITGGNPAIGRVLTSDVSGNGSWRNPIINSDSLSGGTHEFIIKTITIPSGESGMLIMTGHARTRYNLGGAVNAGVTLILSVDGYACSEDFSFEGESSTMIFDASATCIKSLNDGEHTLKLKNSIHEGWLGTERVASSLDYAVFRK